MLGRIGRVGIHLLDILLVNMVFILTLLLRFEGQVPEQYHILYENNFFILTVMMVITFYICGLYRSLWSYASTREMIQVLGACVAGDALFVLWNSMTHQMFPKSVYILYPILLIGGIVASRLSYRFIRRVLRVWEKKKIVVHSHNEGRMVKRIMLVGAGEAAALIIKEMAINKEVSKAIVLCVDDRQSKQGLYLKGIPIKGTTEDILTLAEQYEIDEIIIAMPSAPKKRISEIIQICNETKCKLKIFPGISGVLTLPAKGKSLIRDVKIEDLLGREEIVLNNTKLKTIIKNQVILVTGGGGSIGSELCRQIVSLSPKLLVVLDIYENNAYDLQMELIQKGIPREQIKMIIASIRDKDKLREVFAIYRPNLVFHAAAHKHVPLMEDSPSEAVKNNVFGTLNVAQCAVEFKVEKFIMVSTDKAVNPTNVMGATKRICEMIIQAINETTDETDFVAVRFGNVLGSNGSVIPLFRRQLAAGGPLTVTHPDIIRYFMTIPEAVRLILEATTFATGGEIFVLDMGEPVKIVDLAKNFIKLSGLEVDKDIKIKFTGLRPGEKLFEELLMDEEGLGKTESDKIFIGKPGDITYDALLERLARLKAVVDHGGDIRQVLMDVVPTYNIPEYNQQIG